MRNYQHVYYIQQKEGERASPGEICPYGADEFGARHAWLAGHFDKHGYDAWLLARGLDGSIRKIGDIRL